MHTCFYWMPCYWGQRTSLVNVLFVVINERSLCLEGKTAKDMIDPWHVSVCVCVFTRSVFMSVCIYVRVFSVYASLFFFFILHPLHFVSIREGTC